MNTERELRPEAIIKVLIVDDSEALCKFLCKILSRDTDIEVVGYALDAYEARDKIKQLRPDVITLDIEMPRMDGLTFLRNLMRLRPMPVVMISSLTAAGAEITLNALEAGAVDFLVKRHPGSDKELDNYATDIIKKVKNAGKIRVISRNAASISAKAARDLEEYKGKVQLSRSEDKDPVRIIAVGSSTGGPEALRHLLKELHVSNCAVLIAQHMPERFMAPFAARLNDQSSFDIAVAQSGERLEAGRGYVAQGDHNLELTKQADQLRLFVRKPQCLNGHRPSVNVLFNSVAAVQPQGSIGCLLTGMGDDGAVGLTAMRNAGSLTIVQDENSSAVWGMPGRAFEMGGADAVVPLLKIGPSISNLLAERTK